VLPDHGSFPEMVADTGGGLLCRPHDAADLAEKLAELLLDPARLTQIGLTGQRAIHDRYHATAMAQQTLELYGRLVA
jgi:glycosyltransferase involved in cell wall biosynthesis